MKNTFRTKLLAAAVTFALTITAFAGGIAFANSTAVAEIVPLAADPSPAIAVAQKTANSVVGISGYTQQWSQQEGQKDTLVSQGSGVVIAEGGYILTNYHVIEGCTSFEVLMPDGSYVKAHIVGTDSSTDLAVVQLNERADELVPVEIGTSAELPVGSTVIAIGNPGGEVLANTVTQGIVSALERNVSASNTFRAIKYIQHDASINSGNSGGGLFSADGRLMGINTLKYGGSAYDTVSFEGLGFAIPVDTAYPIAMDLINFGEVQRPQLGISAAALIGPEEAMQDYAPASVFVVSLTDGGSAQESGLMPYDCITHFNGVRVTDMMELTSELDQHGDGDVITLTVVRYANPAAVQNLYSYIYKLGGSNMGGANGIPQQGGSIFGHGYSSSGANSFETLEIEVTLKIPAND